MGQERREKKPTEQLTLLDLLRERQKSPSEEDLPEIPPESPYHPLPGENLQQYLRRVPGPVKILWIEVPK